MKVVHEDTADRNFGTCAEIVFVNDVFLQQIPVEGVTSTVFITRYDISVCLFVCLFVTYFVSPIVHIAISVTAFTK